MNIRQHPPTDDPNPRITLRSMSAQQLFTFMKRSRREGNGLRRLRRNRRGPDKMDMIESANNFPADFLSQAHLHFIASYMELEAKRDAAVLDQFLKEKS